MAIEIENALFAQCHFQLPNRTTGGPTGIANGSSAGFTGSVVQAPLGRVTLRLIEPIAPDDAIIIVDQGSGITYAANPVQRAAFIDPSDHTALIVEYADPNNALVQLENSTIVTVYRMPEVGP